MRNLANEGAVEAHAAVFVLERGTLDRDALERASEALGLDNVFAVVTGEDASELVASAREILREDAVDALATCALVGGLEEENTLAWAEATLEERNWARKVARRVQSIVRARCDDILKRYQPLRDIVTFWAEVLGGGESADGKTSAMLGKIISGAVDGIPSLGVLGAREVAKRHREHNPDLEMAKLKTMIYADSTKSFAAGTVLSLGGPLAAPITSPPALVMYFTIRMRLCLAIAILGEPEDDLATLRPSLIAAALLCFFGADAKEIMSARPTPSDFDLEDLLDDLESADAFRGHVASSSLGGDAKPSKNLGEVLNEKLRRLGEDARERTNEAIQAVLKSGSAASRNAQRVAASQSEHIRELSEKAGKTMGEANRAAERAFVRALPVAIYEQMSAGVFTMENLPILVCELVPAISSYLTVRAATAAMVSMLPESVSAAEQISRDAESEEHIAVDEVEVAESWDEAAKKSLIAATESTKRAAVAMGQATTGAISELNRSLSKMFSTRK